MNIIGYSYLSQRPTHRFTHIHTHPHIHTHSYNLLCCKSLKETLDLKKISIVFFVF